MVQGNSPTSIIIGAGEIGKGLYEVLEDTYGESVFIRDTEHKAGLPKKVDFMHIAFPYSRKFLEYVNTYINIYNPGIVVVHSTVPVGTTDKIKTVPAVHSPVRGKHPRLADSIRTFVKFVGGPRDIAAQVADYFIAANIKTTLCESTRSTELGKILSTTQYGWDIIQMKEIHRICKEHEVPFSEAYTLFNKTYNDGYEEMGIGEYKRSILQYMPNKIGGHCVVQNTALLDDIFTQFVKDFNQVYEHEV